jgi:hypothetical protein
MSYLRISIGIFIVLAASRFVPHPPNFTSLLALSFYVPVFLGKRFIPALILSFAITDILIGYHSLTHWTWGSVFLIGLISNYFSKNYTLRILGSTSGVFIFFIVSNFGVWTLGGYGHDVSGLIICYTLAIPFLGYSLISTLIFSIIIEFIYYIYNSKFKKLTKFP